MSYSLLRAIVACVIALTVSGCRHDASGPVATLQTARDAAKARWDSSAPASYTFVAYRSCECLADATGPVRVTVSGGGIVHVVRVDTGASVDPALWFSINDLFALIDRELQQLPERLAVDYHATLGYPTHVTYGRLEIDGGAIITVSELAATANE